MRVAVTGGSGKIGSVLIRHLLERGHDVVNIDRRQARQPLARFVFADLRHREVVQPVLEQVDAVCHLGEIPGLYGAESPDQLFAHNCAVGASVLQSAADLKLKRVIYTSTAQVYGCWGHPMVPPDRLPIDETEPLRPQNVYALSKVANENYARLLSERTGLSVAAFRFPWVLCEQPSEQWLDQLMQRDGPLEGMGSYLWVEDAARAYLLALEKARPGFEAYHFVADDVTSGRPISQRLRQHHPDFPSLPGDWPAFRCPVNCDKARSQFGWTPSFSIRAVARSPM